MSEKEQDDFWSFQWLVAIFPDCNRPEEKDQVSTRTLPWVDATYSDTCDCTRQFEVRNIPGGGPTNPDGTSMFATIQTLHQMRVEIRQAAAALARTDGFVVLTVKRANRTRPVYSTEPPRTFEHPVPHSSVPVLDPEVLNQKMSADGAIEARPCRPPPSCPAAKTQSDATRCSCTNRGRRPARLTRLSFRCRSSRTLRRSPTPCATRSSSRAPVPSKCAPV
jgi:hypothetical protein